MSLSHNPRIVTRSLGLYLDSVNPKSYPGSGSTWYDISGKGRHATLANCTYANGLLTFNGSTSVATLPNFPFLFGQNSFSISVILQYLTVGSNKGILNNGSGFNTGGNGVEMRIRTNNLECGIGDGIGAGIRTNSGASVLQNTWTDIVFQFNRSTLRGYLYKDGQQTCAVSYAGEVSSSYQADLYIGRGTDDYINMNLASVKIYESALTDAEILQNFNAMRSRYGL